MTLCGGGAVHLRKSCWRSAKLRWSGAARPEVSSILGKRELWDDNIPLGLLVRSLVSSMNC